MMLKNRKQLPALALILATVLIGLLVTLSALQYRWVGELSDSELELTRSALRAGALRFTEDFDHELTSAFVNLQMNRTILHENDEAYARVYDRWTSAALFPKLISDLFVVRAEADGQLQLSRFNQESRRMELVAWPHDFSLQRQQLTERFHFLSYPERRSNVGTLSSPALIDGEIPALIIPMFRRNTPEERARKQIREGRDPAEFGWTIARLNLDYIKQEVLPALAKRYFPGRDDNGRPDYILLIVSRLHPDKVIYSYTQESGAQLLARAEVKVNLFRLPLAFLARMYSDKFSAMARLSDSPDPRTSGKKTAPFIRRQFLRWVLENSEQGEWRMAIVNRAGPLQDAVAAARRRNLIVIFGVLAMLLVSIGMIFLLIRRLHMLAKQQMEFVAGVSHELRTPVAVLCSASENLADGMIQTSEEVLQYGEMIKTESYQLGELVEQVLEFAETQSLRNPYTLTPVSVAAVIECSLASIADEIAGNGFTIEKQLAAGLPQIMADQAALGRAIRNLLNNAMKFGGDQRSINIQAWRGSGKRGSEVMISIEDHGIGIEPEELKSIFEPFRRGRAAISSQIRGSGLGLSLVKHIMAGHHGKVSVQSVPGKGSVFTLHLPVARPGFRELNDRDNSEGDEQTYITD
ncbi:MAG: hypothetical protein J2P41_06820 [Blastocatellia bacterium]|nr:hypothetical protein [Blastocatellia bacterium]